MTWRDVSGPFTLYTQGYQRDPNLAMVKLKLQLDIEFANDGTNLDFEAQKNYFIAKNQYRDHLYDFSQNYRLEGYAEYNLVNIGEHQSHYIGLCWLFFFTSIMLVEFYKSYVESFCIHQDYEIKKVVSTRSNLNLPDPFRPYIARVPAIIVMNNTITYNDPSRLGAVTIVPEIPSLNEIHQSQSVPNQNQAQGGMMTSSVPAQDTREYTGNANINLNLNIGINTSPLIDKKHH